MNTGNTQVDLLETVDSALREETVRRYQEQRAKDEIPSRFRSLATILRLLGAVVLIAAAGTFLFQRWGEFGDHIVRYLSFLGFTGLLSAAGFFCGLKIREDKGARTFLAISAAIIPVHFSQLGGLLYSQFGSHLVRYPDYLRWVAPSGATALVTVAGALAVLLPICVVAFSSLVRAEARSLTLAYLSANAFLLLPVREGNAVTCLAAALFTLLVFREVSSYQKSVVMRTREGLFVRAMMFVPLALLVGRTMQLYEVTTLLQAFLYSAAATTLYVLMPRFMPEHGRAFQAASTLPAAIAWFLVTGLMPYGIQHNLAFAIIPFCAVLFVMGYFAIGGGRGYRTAAALLATAATMLQMVGSPDMPTAFLCMIVSVLSISFGFIHGYKWSVMSGAFGFVVSLLFQIRIAISLYTINPWIGLAVLGTAIVLGSSFIEKNYAVLIERAGALRKRLE